MKNKLNKIRNNKISVISLIYQKQPKRWTAFLNNKHYEYFIYYND